MKLDSQKQSLLFVALIVLGSLLLYHMLFSPFFEKYKDLYEEENSLNVNIKQNVSIIQNAGTIREKYNRMFEKYKLTGDDDEELLKTKQEIDLISRARNLKVTKIQDTPVKESVEYKEFPVQISCVGSLDQIMSFIYYLSESTMLFQVEKVKITPESARNNNLHAFISLSRIGFPE